MIPLLISLHLLCPSEDASPRLAAIKKLDNWVGTWKGVGWSMNEKGERFDFTITESVQRKVAGTVLLLDGKGVRKNDQGEEITTHDGLVVISYDEKTHRYHWHGYDVGREPVHSELKMINGAMQWEVQPPNRSPTIRFTIKIENNRWHETGEVSLDGKAWNKFMEVTLERQN
ncbi:MAG: hypothetical protein QM703_10805 [Gemmatales bacterium]